MNKTLNPKLWKDNKLIPEVRETLINIVDRFRDFVQEYGPDMVIKDICIIGSNASYNYTNKSDIDLHVVADVKNNDCNLKHLGLIYDLFKAKFNNKYDVTIKDIPVEVYVESDELKAESNGIYSVQDDKWIKEPDASLVKEQEQVLDDEQYKSLVERYKECRVNDDLEEANSLLDDIYDLRQESIISVDGEYGQGNLLFKKFRDDGYLDALKDLIDELESEELSLN